MKMSARWRRAAVGTGNKTGGHQPPGPGYAGCRRGNVTKDGRVAERLTSSGKHWAQLLDRARRPVYQEQLPGSVLVGRCRVYLRLDNFIHLRPQVEDLAVTDLPVAARGVAL